MFVVVGDARLASSGCAVRFATIAIGSVCQEAAARWRVDSQLRPSQAQTRDWPSLRQPLFVAGTSHSCSYRLTSSVRNTSYPAGPHRTDTDFTCHHCRSCDSSETFGAVGSPGLSRRNQPTRLLRRLQWHLPYHPSATPSMNITLLPCDEAMLPELPGAMPRANGCVPCSTVDVPPASRSPSLEDAGGCTRGRVRCVAFIPTVTSVSVC